MKLKDMKKEDLELMSYDDIAYAILSESKKKMKINEIFQKICDILGKSKEEYLEQIADFFEILSTDKKFIMLENGFWDLKSRHSQTLVIEDEEDDFEEETIDEEEDLDEEEETNDYYDEDGSDDDTDDLKDLIIIDEEEEA